MVHKVQGSHRALAHAGDDGRDQDRSEAACHGSRASIRTAPLRAGAGAGRGWRHARRSPAVVGKDVLRAKPWIFEEPRHLPPAPPRIRIVQDANTRGDDGPGGAVHPGKDARAGASDREPRPRLSLPGVQRGPSGRQGRPESRLGRGAPARTQAASRVPQSGGGFTRSARAA